MKSERDFWIQVRRGLSIVTHAIADQYPNDTFWRTVLRGLNVVVRAIEMRYNLPRRSYRTIGQVLPEPPAQPLARNINEGIEQSDAV